MNLIPDLSLPMSPIKKVSRYKSKFKERQGFYRHQYLHYLSAHPFHTKKSVVFSQTLQTSKLCSSEKDFENQKGEMKSCFVGKRI